MTKHPSHTPTHPIWVKITLNNHKILRMTFAPLTHKQSQVSTHDKTPISHSYTPYSGKDHSKQPHIFTYDVCTPHTHTPLGWEKVKTKQDITKQPHFRHFFGV